MKNTAGVRGSQDSISSLFIFVYRQQIYLLLIYLSSDWLSHLSCQECQDLACDLEAGSRQRRRAAFGRLLISTPVKANGPRVSWRHAWLRTAKTGVVDLDSAAALPERLPRAAEPQCCRHHDSFGLARYSPFGGRALVGRPSLTIEQSTPLAPAWRSAGWRWGLEACQSTGPSEIGWSRGEPPIEKLFLLGLLRPQDLPLTPDLKLADSLVLVLYLINPLDHGGFRPDITVAYLDFYDAKGNPLTLPITVTQSGAVQTLSTSSVSVNIGFNSTVVVETAATASDVLTGWVRARVSGVSSAMGYAVLEHSAPQRAASQGSVPLDFQNGSVLTLPYDCVDGVRLEVAIAALGAVTVSARAVDENGASLPEASFSLLSNGHAYFNLTDKIPAAAGHRGFVRFTAVPPPNVRWSAIAGTGLRFSPAGGFTTLPKLD